MASATRPVYLDHASTTPVHPGVLQAMEPYLRQEFGNPSNLHPPGRRAAEARERARAQVARVLGCHADEVVFTGGGSESDNLALTGVALARPGGRHLVTTAIEHSAVLGAARGLTEHFGRDVTYVSVGESGIVDPAEVVAAIRPDTFLVSVMFANNEIGTIQPVAEIARLARARGVLVHTDAVQAAGLLDLDVDRLEVDLLSLSAHKFYAPKGVGVLYVRRGTPLAPLIHGGDQEGHRRAGTENVAGIVACGAALELVEQHRPATCARLTALRDRLLEGIEARVPGALLNGDRRRRLPSNVNVCLGDVQGETVLLELEMESVYASSGSACHAGSQDPSHVLLAIGRSPEMAHTALRLTLGAPTTEAEIDRVLEVLPRAVVRIRGGLPPSPPRPPSPRTTEGCDLRPKRDSSLTTTG
jgi:cysteine desulfurase